MNNLETSRKNLQWIVLQESEDEKEGRPESEEYQKLNESSSSADLLEDAPKLAEPKGICNFFSRSTI